MKPFIATKKTIDIRESIGKISASYIIPYPPGIPLICPGGEEITEELHHYIYN